MDLSRRMISCIVGLSWFVILLAIPLLWSEGASNTSGAFQSDLPLPPANPHFVPIAEGGRVYCGGHGSSRWLEIPSAYAEPVPEGGAEFHCDRSDSLSGWNLPSEVWKEKGYLIGFWPSNLSIIDRFYLIFELDPAQLDGICQNCFSAKYYRSDRGQWQALPTFFDPGTARVSIEIREYLPASGYPGYADRFLIALFYEVPTPTPSPTDNPTASPTDTLVPAATQTPQPTVVYTSTPAPAVTSALPTLSETPEPATPTPSPAPTPTFVSSSRFFWIPVGLAGIIFGVALGLWLARRRK